MQSQVHRYAPTVHREGTLRQLVLRRAATALPASSLLLWAPPPAPTAGQASSPFLWVPLWPSPAPTARPASSLLLWAPWWAPPAPIAKPANTRRPLETMARCTACPVQLARTWRPPETMLCRTACCVLVANTQHWSGPAAHRYAKSVLWVPPASRAAAPRLSVPATAPRVMQGRQGHHAPHARRVRLRPRVDRGCVCRAGLILTATRVAPSALATPGTGPLLSGHVTCVGLERSKRFAATTPAECARPARIRRFWALLRHHCASLALHTLSQWKVVATSLIVCAMLATLGLMVGRAAPAFKVHTRATRAALPAHYAVLESTQQAQHRPSAPTARQVSTRHQESQCRLLHAVEQTAAQAALRRRARRRAPSPTAPDTTQTMQTAGGSCPRCRALRFEFPFRRSTQSLATTM